MKLADMLLQELDREMKTTRRLIERVPEGKLEFKPHEKSNTLGWLSNHVVSLVRFPTFIASADGIDLTKFQRPADVKTTAELVSRLESNLAQAREAIAGVEDERMFDTWTLRMGDHVIFSEPRYMVFRSFFMNHHIHHRAQLSVYLRLNDVPLPGMYGPSADEP
ncbi:MAG TPA: DinB family protein [Thermoanaerobaculia bacterium]|nr:DinB family protein [Thermoanaerobaculia bacterium]